MRRCFKRAVNEQKSRRKDQKMSRRRTEEDQKEIKRAKEEQKQCAYTDEQCLPF